LSPQIFRAFSEGKTFDAATLTIVQPGEKGSTQVFTLTGVTISGYNVTAQRGAKSGQAVEQFSLSTDSISFESTQPTSPAQNEQQYAP
jgi:type VI protein secretion system component Hcp